jgi:signal transduction histidine kinase
MSPLDIARHPKRIKAKFFVPFAIALAFILLVFAVAIYSVEQRVRDQDLAERSAAVEKLFAQKLDKDSNLMMATMRALMTNASIERAFRADDRAALAAQGGPLFDVLRNEHRITHLYLISPELVNRYRFHIPLEFGDRMSRASLLQAQAAQRSVHGLELGAMGTLSLRLVMPWQRAGELIGYVEIGEAIEHIIDEIQQSLSVDLIVMVDKQFLSKTQWQRGRELMQGEGDWNQFSDYAALAQTADHLPAALDDGLLNRLFADESIEIKEQGRSLHLARVPILDVGGRQIGHLVMVRDITALEKTIMWSLLLVLLVSLLASVAVLGVFYLALDKVERDYQRQHELEHQLLRLNSEHQRILQLEKLSALGTMVGGIAHQLNNPLVGVVNMAQLAEREVTGNERLRELLSDIRSAGEDCRTFVKRMLAFSKASSFESKPTAMASLIEETVLLFRQAEPRHLLVTLDLEDTSAVISLDPILIRHALFNLLLNAAQAISGSGEIRIRLQRSDDTVRGLPGWLLVVEDQGRGIDAQDLEKIFVPFFTSRSDGTGLGLPVVQHVALLHGGQVSASSEPGHGTRIAMWLPDSLPDNPERTHEKP